MASDSRSSEPVTGVRTGDGVWYVMDVPYGACRWCGHTEDRPGAAYHPLAGDPDAPGDEHGMVLCRFFGEEWYECADCAKRILGGGES